MAHDFFVGRDGPISQLKQLLENENQKQKLVVQSIEGPGGIGKSALLQHALETADIARKKYLVLRISGNEIANKNTFAAVNKMIAGATSRQSLTKPTSSYFTRVAEISATNEKLRAEIHAEIENIKEDKPDLDVVLKLFDIASSLGQSVNEISPKTKEYFNGGQLKKHLPNIESFYKTSKVLLKETPSLLEKIGIGSLSTQRNALRENALSPLGDALYSDLTAILSGYESSETFKASQPKLKEIDRLLLIVDDYETTKDELGEFLTGSFLNQLKESSFETVAIILGRDDILNTHPAWDQHFSSNLVNSIKLAPLTREEMDELVDVHREVSKSEKDRAWSDTLGYPFLVHLWVAEAENGGRSATSLMRFHQRTTRWMNESQKRWLDYAIFMPQINKENFQIVLSNKEEGTKAWAWFENEGSVRDTKSEVFKVNEYLRSRLEEYLRITDPEAHQRIQSAAKKVGAAHLQATLIT